MSKTTEVKQFYDSISNYQVGEYCDLDTMKAIIKKGGVKRGFMKTMAAAFEESKHTTKEEIDARLRKKHGTHAVVLMRQKLQKKLAAKQ